MSMLMRYFLFCFCKFLLDQGVNYISMCFFVPLSRGVYTVLIEECIMDSVVGRFHPIVGLFACF